MPRRSASRLAAPVWAQDSPSIAARDLYAAARYDEALMMLNGLRPQESGNPTALRSIEQYRSLCLLALGRSAEAEAAIAAVVNADPMYLPTETEASPRVRSAFSEVRQRQLPEIARSRYASAKAAFDRKEYSGRRTAVPRAAPAHRRSGHGRTAGRSADARRRLRRPQRRLGGAAAGTEVKPEVRQSRGRKRRRAAVRRAAASRPIRSASSAPTTKAWSARSSIRQDVPRVPTQVASQARDRGLLDVTIDEQGRVIQVAAADVDSPDFDSQLLVGGARLAVSAGDPERPPVKFRKIIQITVSK